jgi:hypothetical protein
MLSSDVKSLEEVVHSPDFGLICTVVESGLQSGKGE